MMNSNMFVMVGLGATRFTTNMTRVGSRARMYSQMILQIVRTMKSFVANVTGVSLVLLVFLNVSKTIVLSYELCTAIIASVRPYVTMRVHVSGVIAVPIKRSAALIALERFGATCGVCPFVQL